jgi:uridine phosphorylase
MKINPLLTPESFLYLFNLPLTEENLAKFASIRYVLMQGSAKRAEVLAQKLATKVLNCDQRYFRPVNLVNTSNFAVYRVGKILSVSHGMGNIAIDTLLHPLTKLLHFAGSHDVEYIRIGTSGGIGLSAGSVVITENAFMPNLAMHYTTYELDRQVNLPTNFDHNLVKRIVASQPTSELFSVVVGNTIAADDFYLGQCRYDGAIAGRIDRHERAKYFQQAQALGIRNFEMESSALAAFCNRAQIPATMIAATLVNRLETDQVSATAEQLASYADRAQQVALNYILKQSDLI